MRFRSCLLVYASLNLWLSASCSRPPAATSESGATAGEGRYTNHLAGEKSPYLQLHAANPVDWYPWGQEAFEKARREDKPIFLSIGYSTCHWCHVMEAESFSNAAIAEVINRSFVAIKVDREERPDVERVYLAYLTSISNGGWPMTLFLTPDLQPFFGATYLPPETRDGEEGLRQVAVRLGESWRTARGPLLKAATEGLSIVEEAARIPRAAAAASDERALDETYASLVKTFDRVNGGFGTTTKFPRPVVLAFLLRYYARTGTPGALEIAGATLRAMARGGIRDHLGGGFHRYTVDAAWRIPHFEKMLYDQAQLISVYTDAFQLTGNAEWANVVRDTAEYVLRDLRDPRGGFYSAEDADSAISATDTRLEEGAFYTWTGDDFDGLLAADAPLARYYYDLPAATGFDGGRSPGGSALAEQRTVADAARQFSLSERAVRTGLETVRARLVETRATRPRPAKDDAIITAWNGLMISALARAGQVLDEPRYVEAALQAGRFVESQLFDAGSAALKRRYRHEAAEIEGLLEDYAFFTQGLLDLYEASHDPHWLTLASRLQAAQDRWFWDEKDGAYFSTRQDAAHLLARMKEDYDGAEPSANSIAAMNLLRLWQLLEADEWRVRADATFRALSGRVARSGSAVPQLMSALDFRQSTPKQIVIAGDTASADTRTLLRLVHERFIPNKVLSVVDGGPQQAELAALVPLLAAMERRDGRATFYLCENYACRLPTTDPAVAARLLDQR